MDLKYLLSHEKSDKKVGMFFSEFATEWSYDYVAITLRNRTDGGNFIEGERIVFTGRSHYSAGMEFHGIIKNHPLSKIFSSRFKTALYPSNPAVDVYSGTSLNSFFPQDEFFDAGCFGNDQCDIDNYGCSAYTQISESNAIGDHRCGSSDQCAFYGQTNQVIPEFYKLYVADEIFVEIYTDHSNLLDGFILYYMALWKLVINRWF